MKSKWERLTDMWADEVVKDEAWHAAWALHYARLDAWIGYPAAGIAALTTTTAFASLAAENRFGQAVVACTSLLVAVMTGLLSFGNFGKKAKQHELYVARCRVLRQDLTFRRSFIPRSNAEAADVFEQVKRLFSDIPPRMVLRVMASAGRRATGYLSVWVPTDRPAEFGAKLWLRDWRGGDFT
jgi:hypothetical protein